MRFTVASAMGVIEFSVSDPLKRIAGRDLVSRRSRVRARGASTGLEMEPGVSPAGRSTVSIDKQALLRRRKPRISERLRDEYLSVGGMEMLGYITVPGAEGSWNAPIEWLIS
jgi:hypothetical protein